MICFVLKDDRGDYYAGERVGEYGPASATAADLQDAVVFRGAVADGRLEVTPALPAGAWTCHNVSLGLKP